MNRSYALASITLSLTALLSACGGGGGSDGGDNTPSQPGSQAPAASLTDAQIIADIKLTNTHYDTGPDGRPMSNHRPPGTWRWPSTPDQTILVHIPRPNGPVEEDLANKVAVAIKTFNAKLSAYFVLEPVSVLPVTGNVIQVGYNNAWVPPGSTDYNSYCANVSNVAGFGSMIVPDSENTIRNPVFVNLGNNHCNVTQDIVNHEFGHALGFAVHFDVFGNTTSPDNFWDVLATLYGNPRSTLAEKLVIKRAAR
ncbi:MAG: hypothetical protein ACRYGO_21485 [Janthinobacterium lividum]